MPTCPHCHQDFEVFGQKEAARHIGVSANTFTQWRKKGWVPDPWHVEGNRPFWIDMMLEEAQRTAGSRSGAGRTVHSLALRMKDMTADERREEMLRLLEQVEEEIKAEKTT